MSKAKAFSITLLLAGFALVDTAAAGFFKITPTPPADVPELDGAGAMAALALVASIGAVLLARSRNR